MKKEVLLLMAMSCLAPMSVHAICFRYVDGPEGLDVIEVEVDSTKIGSNLPTEWYFSPRLEKGSKSYYTVAESIIFKNNIAYVTIKEHKSNPFAVNPTLIKGKQLDNNGAYDITIDNNRNITFTKTDAPCPKRKYK